MALGNNTSKEELMIREGIKSIPTFLVILFVLFVIKYFSIPLFSIQGKTQDVQIKASIINKIKNTSGDIISGTILSGNITNTGNEVITISPIDEVYTILEQGVNGKDYIAIKFPKQKIQYNEGVQASFNAYLKNNIKGFTLPKNVKGYLYIRLAKNLIYMESAKALQPINIYTNVFDRDNQRVYGRIDLTKSLDVYNEKSEFLYDLGDIPLNNVANTGRLQSKAGKYLSIGGVISDTNGNYIESMVFVFTTGK